MMHTIKHPPTNPLKRLIVELCNCVRGRIRQGGEGGGGVEGGSSKVHNYILHTIIYINDLAQHTLPITYITPSCESFA